MRCCGARAGTAPRPAARRAPHTHSPPGDKGTATEAQPELPFGRLTYFVNANKKRRGPLTRRAPLALGAGFSQRPQLAFRKTQRYGRTRGPPAHAGCRQEPPRSAVSRRRAQAGPQPALGPQQRPAALGRPGPRPRARLGGSGVRGRREKLPSRGQGRAAPRSGKGSRPPPDPPENGDARPAAAPRPGHGGPVLPPDPAALPPPRPAAAPRKRGPPSRPSPAAPRASAGRRSQHSGATPTRRAHLPPPARQRRRTALAPALPPLAAAPLGGAGNGRRARQPGGGDPRGPAPLPAPGSAGSCSSLRGSWVPVQRFCLPRQHSVSDSVSDSVQTKQYLLYAAGVSACQALGLCLTAVLRQHTALPETFCPSAAILGLLFALRPR